MATKAKFWKKLRRWVSRKINGEAVSVSKSVVSEQVGKLFQSGRGEHIITMTTL